jgi:hypothetical protein
MLFAPAGDRIASAATPPPGYLVYESLTDPATGLNGWDTISTHPGNPGTTVGKTVYGIAPDLSGAGGYALMIADSDSAGQASVTKGFEAQNGLLSVQWDVQSNTSLTQYGRVLLRNGSTAALEISTSVSNGQLRLHYINSGNAEVAIADISDNTWYTVRVIADMVNKAMDVYVNDVKKVSGVPFKSSQAKVDSFMFVTPWGSSGAGYIKNVIMTNQNVPPIGQLPSPTPTPTPLPTPTPISKLEVQEPVSVDNWKGVTWDPEPLGSGMYDEFGLNGDINNMKYAGIHWVRVWTGYWESEAALEQRLTALKNAGLQAFLIYKDGDRIISDADEAIKVEKLKSVVAKYKDYIKYWEIHNEQNLDSYWYLGNREGEGTTDPAAPFNAAVHNYVLRLQNYYQAIKSVDPDAVVICGGLSDYMYTAFIERLRVEEAYKYFDEFAFHPYDSNPDMVIQQMDQLYAIMDTWPAPYKDMPVWYTEIGFSTTPGGSSVPNEATKAAYLTELMTKMLQRMKVVRPIIWYGLHETSTQAGFGLTQKFYSGGKIYYSRLPALDAYRAIDDHANAPVAAQSEVVVSLGLIDAVQTASVNTSVYYDSSRFALVDVQLTGPAAVSSMIYADEEPGKVRIAVNYTNTNPGGKVADLRFTTNQAAGTRASVFTSKAEVVQAGIMYQALDGSLSLTVVGAPVVNAAPVLDAIGSKHTSEGAALVFRVNAVDPNEDTLAYSADSLPAGAVFDNSNKTFSWTPAFNQSGAYTVRFDVTDGTLSAYEEVTILVNDQAEFAIGTPIFKDAAGNTLTHLRASADLRSSVSITNQTVAEQHAAFILALYAPDGTFRNLSFVEGSIQANETMTLSAGFRLPPDVTGYTVKAFVWDSIEGMQPLSNVVTFQ